ncbi:MULTISPECIES: hypothetical protein [Shewanella]|nr:MULTISPECIES: hypothetical protein [Shewanella]
MSKEHRSSKNQKKQPLMTAKEKRAAKHAKKQGAAPTRVENINK